MLSVISIIVLLDSTTRYVLLTMYLYHISIPDINDLFYFNCNRPVEAVPSLLFSVEG